MNSSHCLQSWKLSQNPNFLKKWQMWRLYLESQWMFIFESSHPQAGNFQLINSWMGSSPRQPHSCPTSRPRLLIITQCLQPFTRPSCFLSPLVVVPTSSRAVYLRTCVKPPSHKMLPGLTSGQVSKHTVTPGNKGTLSYQARKSANPQN